jgi:hypothetical protein
MAAILGSARRGKAGGLFVLLVVPEAFWPSKQECYSAVEQPDD